MKNLRKDGKSRNTLFGLCFFAGTIGANYFYLNQKKQGGTIAAISGISTSLVTLFWIVYASIEVGDNFNHGLVIVLPTILLLMPFMLAFAGSMYLCFKIVVGSYQDETKTPISKGNSSPQDVVNYYLNL